MQELTIGCVIRGKYIEDSLISFGGRSNVQFRAPDPNTLLPLLPLKSPIDLADLYALSMDDILDYLQRLGDKLDLKTNLWLQQALEVSSVTASQTPPLIRASYENLPQIFQREFVNEIIETRLGRAYLDGWVDQAMLDGRTVSIRAFGARALHIIAGNSPLIAGLSIMRNAITRSDAIIKSPSNDPFTALAIARTMVEMDPDHPITKHISVAYWKGGDEVFEEKLYRPQHIEKIIAWGGFSSVKHVTRYIQPGLELISLDPKRSVSIIGPEVFASETVQREIAKRLAADMGALNQEGCVNARVVYVISGTDDEGVQRLNQFGQYVYDALMSLPEWISTKPKSISHELRSELENATLNDDWYHVVGGKDDEGAIIVSQFPEPVDFAKKLGGRIANLVPVDTVNDVFSAVDSYTQTVGVYPESLKSELCDRLPLYGAQRITSLGYAASASIATPQDAIEPLRRMCKWIVNETCDPQKVAPLWEGNKTFADLTSEK